MPALLATTLLIGCGGPLSAEQRLWCAANGDRVEAARQTMRGGQDNTDAACLLAYQAAHPSD
jgi:hypothetical protein